MDDQRHATDLRQIATIYGAPEGYDALLLIKRLSDQNAPSCMSRVTMRG